MNRFRLKLGLFVAIAIVAAIALHHWRPWAPSSAPGWKSSITTDSRAPRIELPQASLNRRSLSGTVFDGGERRTPVGGALICVDGPSATLPECVASDRGGRFELPIPGDVNTVSASAAGYLPFATRLKADQAVLDIVLVRGGVTVAGRVIDGTGGVVEGALVRLLSTASPWFHATPVFVITAPDGTFKTSVPRGPVRAAAFHPSYAHAVVDAWAPAGNLEFTLLPDAMIRGRVIDAATGSGVAGALVFARDPDERDDNMRTVSTATDESGEFALAGLAPGRYKPVARARGWYGACEMSVDLSLADVSPEVRIPLHRVASLDGRVLAGPDDVDCPAGRVDLDAGDGRVLTAPILNGLAVFPAVLPGRYHPQVNCDGFVSANEYPAIEVGGAEALEAQWKVGQGLPITGTVLTRDGSPVPAAVVAQSSANPGRSFSGLVDATGHFSVLVAAPGLHTVAARVDGFVTPPAQDVDVADTGPTTVDFMVETGCSIDGLVSAVDGSGMPDVVVRMKRPGTETHIAHTSLDGTFELHGVQPGTWTVDAAPVLPGGGRGASTESTLELSNSCVRDRIELVLETVVGRITGIVTLGAAEPAVDVLIGIGPDTNEGPWFTLARSNTRTDEDGRFIIPQVPLDASYRVWAYDAALGEAATTGVRANDEVSLRLRNVGVLGGTVVTAAGTAPRFFTVTARDETHGFRRREAYFSTSGGWEMGGMPGGTYRIMVAALDGEGELVGIELPAGDRRLDLRVELPEAATIEGTVRDAESGEAIADVVVVAGRASGGISIRDDALAGDNVSKADGTFVVAEAPVGLVRLLAMHLDSTKQYAPVETTVMTQPGEVAHVDLAMTRRRDKGLQP